MAAKSEPKNVYQLMSELRGMLAKAGIGKNQRNTQQNYKFRGIDDVYNTIAPMMAEIGLIASPSVMERQVVERATAKGSLQMHVYLKVQITFIAADNPESRHSIVAWGEGMDVGDKATNKALSSAYKYAIITELTIPTEGNEDADQEAPEAQAPAKKETQLVSAKEALDIEMAVKRLNIDGPAFLKWVRAKSFDTIPAEKLPVIYKELERRESELRKEHEEGQGPHPDADLPPDTQPSHDELNDDLPF